MDRNITGCRDEDAATKPLLSDSESHSEKKTGKHLNKEFGSSRQSLVSVALELGTELTNERWIAAVFGLIKIEAVGFGYKTRHFLQKALMYCRG